ncbi:MAG: GNAT family N-acetyltransferase [Candidatus Ranarchaeia archaeon]|jgi:GNAT superfamily N-acetyltransferase
MDVSISIRQATLEDVKDLVRLRRLMFEDMGIQDSKLLDELDHRVTKYLEDAIPNQHFYGWIAETPDGDAVGSGGVVIDHHPPQPSNLSGKSGYIMNISTDRSYRRKGIARLMMKVILKWLKQKQITKATLVTTPIARPLYEEFGFQNRNGMKLQLD